MEIPAKLQAEIRAKVSSGRYRSSGDVLRRAMRVLTEIESAEESIKREIALSQREIAEGKGIPGDKVLARLRNRYQKMQRARQAR